MTKPYRGIYYIQNKVLFPTQIIVTGELDRKDHTWLKALSDRMKKQDIKELLEYVSMLTQKFGRELADSVLEVSLRANSQMIEELRGDDSMCQALLEIMGPEINKIVDAATEEAAKEATKKMAERLIRMGKMTAEEIAECTQSLSVNEIKELESEIMQMA